MPTLSEPKTKTLWDEWQETKQVIRDLETALGEKRKCEKELVRQMTEELHSHPGVTLTPRQHQMAEIIRQGHGLLSNKEMASMLNVTERTIKFHVSALLMLYSVQSRQELYNCLINSNSKGTL